MFFSDLENFSSHSETLAPDDLLVQISTYLEEVSSAISEEGGTVDKFIGDGVMAFWNAPVERPDHVLRGCTAALRCGTPHGTRQRCLEAEGRPRIHIRIGLNCANVLVGNVGSSNRLSYTALGDGVNVAARLEGINKHVWHHDLHQRQHLRPGKGGHARAADQAGSGQGPQDRVHDL